MNRFAKYTRTSLRQFYREAIRIGDPNVLRTLCKEDLFFLLAHACRRPDIDRPWLYDRCREVEANPDGHLDLWFREGYKSTIITFGKTIQDILNNPDITIGIFSHTRPIAKGFLDQIKRELESNTMLKDLFPEIFYKEPQKESPSWSLDGGIIVKRKANPKEKTIEAWGLVDGQPTSKHFSLLIYDDVVTIESVTTPEQIKKVTDAWALSLNLGAKGGVKRYVGTRYHFNDTYKTILERKAAFVRKHPATDDGTMTGKSVFLEAKDLMDKRREMGPYIFSAQMLLDPVADRAMGFKQEWLNYYHQTQDDIKNKWTLNKYLLVDPASKKKKSSDYTVMAVIGLAMDNNYYLIDAVRDRMNLTERTNKVFEFVRKHNPMNVGYEEYGLQSDIEHIKFVMEQEHYRFKITPLGGKLSKEDRIRRLVPVFEQARFWLPGQLLFRDCEKTPRDFTKEFVDDEFLAFPVSTHDDMLDCVSRIVDSDLQARFPERLSDSRPLAVSKNEPDRVETEYDLWK